MNVEVTFIRIAEREKLLGTLRERLHSSPDSPDSQDSTPLPSSYGVLLAKNSKRKVATSPSVDGWVQLIESKGVADFALAERLSNELATDSVVVQVSDVVGSAGYAHYANGQLLSSRFVEEGDDPVGEVRAYLARVGITAQTATFLEAVRSQGDGWITIS